MARPYRSRGVWAFSISVSVGVFEPERSFKTANLTGTALAQVTVMGVCESGAPADGGMPEGVLLVGRFRPVWGSAAARGELFAGPVRLVSLVVFEVFPSEADETDEALDPASMTVMAGRPAAGKGICFDQGEPEIIC